MLCGTILGSKRGALAVLLFLLLVAIGLPPLSGGRGDLGLFVFPSAGFLIGWHIAALVTGLLAEKWRGAPLGVVGSIASIIGGVLVMYIFGTFGMSITLEKSLIEASGLVTAFSPVDILKAVIADMLTAALAKARPASVLSRTEPAGAV